MAGVEDFDERQIKGIGTLQVLAAGGLVLPASAGQVRLLGGRRPYMRISDATS